MSARAVLGALLLLFQAAPAIAGQAEPLQHVEGPLYQVDGLGEITDTRIGSFRLDTDGAGDLRETPGTAELTLSGGGTLASADAVVNGARSVDPASGRPLRAGGTTCATGAEPGCLPVSHCLPTFTGPDPVGECDISADVSAFRAITGGTIGVGSPDLNSAPLTMYNSLLNLFTGVPASDPLTQPTLAGFLSALVAANTGALGFASAPQAFGVILPVVSLHRDVGDTSPGAGFFAGNPAFDTLNRVLTPAQQALLGCGPFYGGSGGADCDVSGISLLLTEAGAFLGGSPGLHDLGADWDLTDPTVPQPGTVAFEGTSVCERVGDGGSVRLPGCRGPDDPLYDATVDGTATGLVIPFFDPSSPFFQGTDGKTPCETPSTSFHGCQRFESEIAAVAWNALMLLAGLSSSSAAVASPDQLLDPHDPLRQDGCSFARPQLCLAARILHSLVATELDDDPSGPPQQRWLWETGAEYLETDEATGALADFAGWTFHALGPEVSRRDSRDGAGVLFVLGPPDDVMAPPDSPLVVRGPGPDGLVGTSDDPFVGLAYGVVPEPSRLLLQLAALLTAAGVARCRRSRLLDQSRTRQELRFGVGAFGRSSSTCPWSGT